MLPLYFILFLCFKLFVYFLEKLYNVKINNEITEPPSHILCLKYKPNENLEIKYFIKNGTFSKMIIEISNIYLKMYNI